MHPDVCRFISEVVYESRLDGMPEVARQTHRVRHRACASCRSSTSATRPRRPRRPSAIAAEIAAMVGGAWTDRDGDDGSRSRRRTSWSSRPTTPRCGGSAKRSRAAGPGGSAGRHGRQVPGPRGGGRLLLDGDLERRGRAAQPRVPLLPQPPQRRRLAGDVPGRSSWRAHGCSNPRPDDRADAAYQRAVQVRGSGCDDWQESKRGLRDADSPLGAQHVMPPVFEVLRVRQKQCTEGVSGRSKESITTSLTRGRALHETRPRTLPRGLARDQFVASVPGSCHLRGPTSCPAVVSKA